MESVSKILPGSEDDETRWDIHLNVVIREVSDDGETYYPAECPEIPGCVSEGATEDEAKRNIQDAMRLCLSVIPEDAVRQLADRAPLPDFEKLVKRSRMHVRATPQLQYA